MKPDPTRRLARIHTLAWVLTLLSLAVVAISAWVRLSGAGLGCADWPACYGRLLVEGGSMHVGIIRAVHRITATASLLLAFAVAWLCIRPEPLQPAARQATLLVVLMLVLSAVGIWSADARRALPGFINILGGLGLVSLSWRLVLGSRNASAEVKSDTPDPLLRAGAVLLAMAMALGALIGARYAALSCATLPFCDGAFWPATDAWGVLNPAVTLTSAPVSGDSGGVALHLLHRYAALAAVLLLGVASVRALRAEPARLGPKLVLVLLAGEVALGLFTVASGFSLPLAILHSTCAAMLLAAVATQLRR